MGTYMCIYLRLNIPSLSDIILTIHVKKEEEEKKWRIKILTLWIKLK